ncbi:MAG: hypothetical protein Q8Q12_14075 [bacterium]|nr:hypothetical protein [bacterium]
MGADLYIPSLYDPQKKEWKPCFNEAVEARNRLERGTPEYEAAQKRVEESYEQMLSQGYFRDPYNNLDVLWQFDLSWWRDISPLLDKHGFLPVPKTRQVLKMLDQHQPDFDQNMAKLPAKDQEFYKAEVRIPRDGDQRSELMSITIPK